MVVQDKVAIVTGASSGIGEATAKLLTEHGAKVVLAARSKEKLDELAKTLKDSFVVQVDMSDVESIKNMVKQTVDHFERVDILVNNAGRGYDTTIERIEVEKLTDLYKVDLLGPIIAMQEVIPQMRKVGEGSIVNVSSGTAFMNIPGIGAYSSIKRALIGISLTAREELKNDKITVSLVYPYITETNFGQNMIGEKREDLPTDQDKTLEPPDKPELIAEKILEAIESGEAEILAHDWMRDLK